MNFYEMRHEIDKLHRSIDDASFQEFRDDWLNQAWEKIAELFVIPSLERVDHQDSVNDQQTYPFPYDYGGAEVKVYFKQSSATNYRRLDPVDEDVLALMHERRSGNMGAVWYYDWTNNIGSDYAVRSCTLVNGSATVACATAAAEDVDRWIRFDPAVSGNATINPGDYGYKILSVVAGVSLTLDRTYRGPAGVVNGRITPAEQQQFILYGIPNATVTDGIELKYFSRPRKLYNDTDVPEWPHMGLGIVYMAISIGFDYLLDNNNAKVWYGRAMSKIEGLKRRKEVSKMLVTDLTIGSVTGRKTGPRPTNMRRTYR